VIADRARGFPWSYIADRHGLSERQCRNIWTARRDGRSDLLSAAEREALVHDALDAYDAAIEELAVLADETANDAVRLGSIKARTAVVKHRLEFLQAIGLLPKDLYAVALQIDAERLVASILRVLDDFGFPDAAHLAVLESLEAAA